MTSRCSCVNPILYAFLSDNFRKAFHAILPAYCCCFFTPSARRRRRRTSLHYELTTLKSGTRNGGDTKRYGKRGKLVKHAAVSNGGVSPEERPIIRPNNNNRRCTSFALDLEEHCNMNGVSHSPPPPQVLIGSTVQNGVVLSTADTEAAVQQTTTVLNGSSSPIRPMIDIAPNTTASSIPPPFSRA